MCLPSIIYLGSHNYREDADFSGAFSARIYLSSPGLYHPAFSLRSAQGLCTFPCPCNAFVPTLLSFGTHTYI